MNLDADTYWKLVELALALDDKSSFYWNFYVVANIAILGWILSNGHKILSKARIVGILGYLLFTGMNYIALYGNYALYDIVVADIRSVSTTIANASKTCPPLEIMSTSQEMPYSRWKIKLFGGHVSSDILMICFILLYGKQKQMK